jgi:uroporphyrinogen-III synthase
MAILVTRPQSDNVSTTAALRAMGFEVLSAPMLRFEPVAFQSDDSEARFGAVIVTSANALRAVEGQAALKRLHDLPLFAVGERTAQTARDIGFRNVVSADGDATALRELMLARVRAKTLKKNSTLLYLAGADLARDLPSELGERGFNVVTQTTYRMAPIESLPRDVCDAFAGHGVEAVLHYSRRSARAFLNAARSGGVEISALAIPQCCLSEAVAAILRDAGAAQVMVARTPDEKALFEVLPRALKPLSR